MVEIRVSGLEVSLVFMIFIRDVFFVLVECVFYLEKCFCSDSNMDYLRMIMFKGDGFYLGFIRIVKGFVKNDEVRVCIKIVNNWL